MIPRRDLIALLGSTISGVAARGAGAARHLGFNEAAVIAEAVVPGTPRLLDHQSTLAPATFTA